MRGLSRNTGSLVAPAIPGYVPSLDERLAYDPDKARRYWPRRAILTASRSRSSAPTTTSSTRSSSARRPPRCGRGSGSSPRSISRRTASRPPSSRAASSTWRSWLGQRADARQLQHPGPGRALQERHRRRVQLGRLEARRRRRADRQGGADDRSHRAAGLPGNALQILHDDITFLPLHQQPMAWATGKNVASVLQLSDNKARHWLTMMR